MCFDGVDNNCDGAFDDETSIDAFSGYLDLDGDGYGGGDWEASCDDIYYAQNLDCDDNDDTISPDATEVCDGIDNDCDGNADSAGLCPCNFETNNGSNLSSFAITIERGLLRKESVLRLGITW